MGAHDSAASDSLAEFRGGERWQRKTAGQREGERVRKGEKGGCEGREGWGGMEESKGKSGCAPPETKSWLRHWWQHIWGDMNMTGFISAYFAGYLRMQQ